MAVDKLCACFCVCIFHTSSSHSAEYMPLSISHTYTVVHKKRATFICVSTVLGYVSVTVWLENLKMAVICWK